MATKTRKRRPVKGTKRRRVASAAKPGRNGAAVKKGAGSKHSPKQPLIKGLEDVDERIPELDKECKVYIDAKDQQSASKTEAGTALTRIGELIHKHNLKHYVHGENKFFIKPGAETVAVEKVKQK